LSYFPESYQESADILIVLIWSLPLTMLAAIEINIMQITNREKQSARILVITAIITVMLNIVMITYLGAMGAAIALLVGSTLREAQMYIDIYRNFMHKQMALHFIRPVIGGLVMLAIALAVGGTNVWLAAGLAVIAYVSIIFLSGGVRPNEIRTLLGSR
jgi:O-antigen/teichoic acid export membrane protein